MEGDSKLVLPADDRIFLGEALFETLKVENAKPCCADLHWQRLGESARKLNIPFDLQLTDWMALLFNKIIQDKLIQGGIKAILSAGSAPRDLAAIGQNSHLVLQSFNYTAKNHPLRLVSASWLRDSANPIYQVKSINYLESILARRHALSLNADDVLFFNLHQHATETTVANLFVIHQKRLLTPPLTDGVLPGITRARILALAKQQHIKCIEVSLTKPMLADAEIVFTSNALQGIRVVQSLDEVMFEVEHPWIWEFISLLKASKIRKTSSASKSQ